MAKLLNDAAASKASHPKAWERGVALAYLYSSAALKAFEGFNLNDPKEIAIGRQFVPMTVGEVPGCVSFAVRERLLVMVSEMMAEEEFKTKGFEPTEQALAALAVSFSIKLEELFTEFARDAEKINAAPVLSAPASKTGCLVLLCLIVGIVVLLGFNFR